ncbi:hypothetical protein ACSQ67_005985 [Phaseolus vulgaris]
MIVDGKGNLRSNEVLAGRFKLVLKAENHELSSVSQKLLSSPFAQICCDWENENSRVLYYQVNYSYRPIIDKGNNCPSAMYER